MPGVMSHKRRLDNVILYQTPIEDQLLPYEHALSTALCAWFKLNGHQLEVRQCPNAENMSPNGTIPFICINDQSVIADWQTITDHFRENHKFAPTPKDEYKLILNTVVYEAIMHICWCMEDVYSQYTSKRYFANLPWPVNKIVCFQKRRSIRNVCRTKEVHSKQNALETLEIFSEINKTLSEKTFLGGESPSETDALLYGFMDSIKALDQESIARYFSKLLYFDQLNRHYTFMQERLQSTNT